jgi:hypothetical protein
MTTTIYLSPKKHITRNSPLRNVKSQYKFLSDNLNLLPDNIKCIGIVDQHRIGWQVECSKGCILLLQIRNPDYSIEYE